MDAKTSGSSNNNKNDARQRGWSVATDGTHESGLADEIKRQLLESMPSSHAVDDDEDDHHAPPEMSAVRKRTSSDMSDDDSSGDEYQNAKKHRSDNGDRSRIQAMAQGRLSKWAARLFDPDRPRGLVEPPQVIPLNDEFLKAFGKREKAFDKARGVQLTIDRDIDESNNDDLYGDTPTTLGVATKPVVEETDGNVSGEGCKVRIHNLNYTTRQTDLLEACTVFGVVTKVDLDMEDETLEDNAPRNRGRAFIYFDTEEGAKACVEGLTELDGRPLRVELASSSGGTRGRASVGNMSSRYYARDISTKCYRCGEVGHRESDCINPARAKPCPICAGIDHELRACPIKAICFNCGIPGHVSRSCNMARGMPQPMICTVCFQKGHNKMNCRQSYRDAVAVSSKGLCMVCGEEGHYLCQEPKWFFSIEGVSCGNCGQSGHIGEECRRPNVEQLSRDDELARKEVEMVMEGEERMGRRRQRDQQSGQQRRARSAAPRMVHQRSTSNGQHRSRPDGSQYNPREPREWG
mmetsp:Transcript_2420/g.4823  ORF Transcript_2420/g.4823 Transcript_2420/m.4823 type:complete len:521 (-) Transcript_2420:76-1638(-)